MPNLFTRITVATSAGVGLLLVAASPAFAAPNPKPNLPGNVGVKVDRVLGMGMALVIAACVAGIFLTAGQMALAIRRGEGSEAVGKLGAVAAACVLVGSAAGIVTYLAA